MSDISEARDRLFSKNSDDTDALSCIAEIVGLPGPEALLHPGAVVTWTFDQWKSWGGPYGFAEIDRSKHCYQLQHTKLPNLRISKASTSSDFRSGFKLGSDVRRSIIAELRFLRAMACCVLSEHPGVSLDELRTTLLSAEDRKPWLSHVAKMQLGRVDEKATLLGRALSANLAKLEKLGVPAKTALSRAGVEADGIERMLVVLKSNLVPKDPNLEDIVDSLADQIETEKVVEEAEAAEKAKAREVEEVKKPPVLADQAEIVYNAELTRAKGRMLAAVKSFHERVNQLSTVARGLSEALEGSLFPAFPSARMRELKAEIQALTDKLSETAAADDAAETANKILQDRVNELENIVTELQREKAETEKLFNEVTAGPEWKAACTKLVAKLEPLLAATDFLAVAQGMVAARVVLADAKKAIDAGVAPTVI